MLAVFGVEFAANGRIAMSLGNPEDCSRTRKQVQNAPRLR